jgi:NAD(P)H-dependent FMN reductase
VSQLQLAIIVGSTRPGRKAAAVAAWVHRRAAGRPAARYDIVDLADEPLPLLDEPIPPSRNQYAHDHTKAWAATIGSYDGFVFVTPEYNHSTSAALKNAIDYLYAEWNNKAAAFVSYGSTGGVRAVEHLRAICSEVQIAHVRQQVSFNLFTDFENMTTFTPGPLHEPLADAMFTQLESWARAMKTVRQTA